MSKKIEERIADLKAMDRIIRACNNENIFYAWIAYSWVPDEASDEDFEFVAEDDDRWAEQCNTFGRYITRALNDGGFYFDKKGKYIVNEH